MKFVVSIEILDEICLWPHASLDINTTSNYCPVSLARVAQSVERRTPVWEAPGSNPRMTQLFFFFFKFFLFFWVRLLKVCSIQPQKATKKKNKNQLLKKKKKKKKKKNENSI